MSRPRSTSARAAAAGDHRRLSRDGLAAAAGEIIAAAHHRGVPVLVDAAQLAPHRPLPAEADFLAWSGHKMYAPFGAGVLVGPRQVLAAGDPFGPAKARCRCPVWTTWRGWPPRSGKNRARRT